MSSKRKEYKVDDHAEKAARFFVACEANAATKVKVTEAMWVRGYSDRESANLMPQMQMHHTIQRNGKARRSESQREVVTDRPTLLPLDADSNLRPDRAIPPRFVAVSTGAEPGRGDLGNTGVAEIIRVEEHRAR
jgi:hypothetical protein